VYIKKEQYRTSPLVPNGDYTRQVARKCIDKD
jgi:hypothetical protein